MLPTIIRTFILYFTVVFALRIMGKREIGQLQPSELAVAIMVSELASLPMSSKDIPILDGIIPVLTLTAFEILISLLVLKNVKIRNIVYGTPSVIVEDGKLKIESLKSNRFTTDDLLEQMRLNGVQNISDIQYAILETNGEVSFFLKKPHSGVVVSDLNLELSEEFLPFAVIVKGSIEKKHLRLIEKTEEWLFCELKKKKINIKDVLIMMANREKIMFIQLINGRIV